MGDSDIRASVDRELREAREVGWLAEVKRAGEITELLTRDLSAHVAARRAIALVQAMEESPEPAELIAAGVSANRISKLVQRGRLLIKLGGGDV